MILQAADWGSGKEGSAPPPLLTVYLRCLRHHTLPKGGGLEDQRAGEIEKMETLLDVARAHSSYERDGKKPGQMAKWSNDHPLWHKQIRNVRELRQWQIEHSG